VGAPTGDILNAAVRVVNESVDRLAGVLPEHMPISRAVEGQIGAQRLGYLPADHPAEVHVDEESGVHPAGEGLGSR
jgi:hypothetical protein